MSKDTINPRLDEVFDKIEFYKPLIKDKEFKKFWKQTRLKRLNEQKDCLYCSQTFTDKNPAVLHHREMPQSKSRLIKEKKASIVVDLAYGKLNIEEAKNIYSSFMQGLEDYYKTLQDTDLICTSCHSKQHRIRTSRQRKL